MSSIRRFSLAAALAVVCLTTSHSEDVIFTSLTRRPSQARELATNVSVITRDQIEQSNAQTLEEVLEMAPSVDVSRSGSVGSFASVRLRGVPTSNQVQLVINDQPVGGVGVQAIDWSLIPVDQIEQIEIVRGGASVLYGANTIGGVIHVKTRQAPEEKARGEFRYLAGSHQTQGVSVTQQGRSDKTHFRVTGGGYRTDGFQQNSDVDQKHLSGETGWSFSNGARLALEASFLEQDQGSPSGTPVSFDQWNGHAERRPNTPTNFIEKTFEKERVHLSFPVPGGFIQSTGYRGVDSYKLFFAPGTTPLADYRNTVVGNDTRYLGRRGFTAGVSGERDERRSQGQIPHHISNMGAYVQQELEWGKLYVAPALRLDQHSTFGNEWNPRLTLTYAFVENWKASANAARSFRAPTLVDLYVVSTDPSFPAFDFFGNPNLDPEIAWTYDAGVEWGELGKSRAAVTGFFTRIRDRITAVDTDGNGNNDTLQNTSKAEISGVESEISLRTGFLFHRANHTYQRAKGTTATSTDFVALRLTPDHLFRYQVSADLPAKITLINTVQYVAHQRQFDGNTGLIIPSYGIWSARVEKEYGPLTAWLQGDNLTDKRYAESITFGNFVPQPGRTLWGGATVSFGE